MVVLFLKFICQCGFLKIMEKVKIKKAKGLDFFMVCLLYLSLKVLGIKRNSHLEKEPDKGVAKVLGLKELPHSVVFSRDFSRLKKEQIKKELFNPAIKHLYKLKGFSGRKIAIDAHFIPYYGSKDKRIKKGYCPSKGKTLRGFKLYTLYDIEEDMHLSYILTDGNANDGKMLEKLLNEYDSLIGLDTVEILFIDKGFYSGENFDYLEKEKVYFVIPAKRYKSIKNFIEEVVDKESKNLIYGRACEMDITIPTGESKLRLICRKQDKIRKSRPGLYKPCLYGIPAFLPMLAMDKETLLKALGQDYTHLKVFKTVYPYLSNNQFLSAMETVKRFGHRWRQENSFEELVNSWHIDNLPGTDVKLIDVSIVFTLIGYNLISFFKKKLGGKYSKMKMNTLRAHLMKLVNLSVVHNTLSFSLYHIKEKFARVLITIWDELASIFDDDYLLGRRIDFTFDTS